ncbi:MAG: hypothetical protein ABIH87_03600 [bacterium]
MLNNSKNPKSWQKTLNLINQCPACGKSYNSDTSKLFLDVNKAHLVHITCQACSSYFLAMIMEFGRGISTIGMVTDLNFEDIKRLYSQAPIELNEAIDGCQEVEQKF